MNSDSSFFADPKIIISLLAFCISIISLIFTFGNQWEQNRRWDKLNVANVTLKEVKMTPFKSITRDMASSIKWGYVPLIYGSDFNDHYTLPYKLIIRDAITKNRISDVNASFTIEEVRQELVRIGFKGEGTVFLMFKPTFVFDNKGKTEAKSIEVKIDMMQNSKEWQEAYVSNTKIDLAGDQGTHVYFEFEYPTSIKIPDEIFFKIKLSYNDIHNNLIKKEIVTKWISSTNEWSYSN